ncbi:zf-HC2 domain-containing protein [Micromonospora sp. CA-111912]|uniref:zf-HC2 domain-containing protein n=1 Tax=Micromonospora sp. CA-111912 TaxID=3239955 RepID=UPI003D8B8303
MRQSLGMYLLGSLNPQERDEVERHLAVCPACLAESDELGEVVAVLALISEEDRRGIVEEFGAPRLPARDAAAATSGAATSEPAPPAADRPVSDAASRTRTRAGTGPGRPSSASRPGTRRSVRARRLVGIAGPVLVVLISAGLFVGLAAGGEDGDSGRTAPADVTLAATAAADMDGATLSVVAVGHDGAVTVRATVTKLKPGTRYQLYAVTTDGNTHLVAGWVGSDTVPEVTGEAPVDVGALSFFAVTRADGTPVVSAYVSRQAPPSR